MPLNRNQIILLNIKSNTNLLREKKTAKICGQSPRDEKISLSCCFFNNKKIFNV